MALKSTVIICHGVDGVIVIQIPEQLSLDHGSLTSATLDGTHDATDG